MSNEEEIYQDEIEKPIKSRRNLTELQRKILAYGIVSLVAFSLGCGIVGFSMLAKENGPRKDLGKNDFYLRNIISSFDVSVFNSTSTLFSDHVYDYNDSTINTFDDINGIVNYFDIKEEIEYMEITFVGAPELSIKSITFHVNEKSQLNIIIFADGREVYNALRIKKDISIELVLLATEISVYVF